MPKKAEPEKKPKIPKELEALMKENEELIKECEEYKNEAGAQKDLYMRTAAEYDNFRKRSQRERETLYADIKADTVGKLLPAIDNLDRAIDAPTADLETYKKGVEMTLNQIFELIGKMGIESFGEPGEEFNPELHSAVMHTEDESLGNNIIVNVLQKGYKSGDKVIRPAMVQVAN